MCFTWFCHGLMLLQFWAMALKTIGKTELYQMLNVFLGMTKTVFSCQTKKNEHLGVFQRQLKLTPPFFLENFWLKMP